MGLRFTLALGAASSLACAIAFMACGIESGGIVEDAGISTDLPAPPNDVMVPDTNIPPSCGDAAACLKPAIPNGWQITALLSDPKAMCPADFALADHIKDISLSSGSCACSCGAVGTARCGDSNLTSGTSTSCTSTDAGVILGDGGCSVTTGGGGMGVYLAASEPPLVGITCAATRLGDAEAASVPVRLCDPTCKADFCGELGSGATACIVSPGDVACPPGFNQRTPLATAADPTCAACACGAPTKTCSGTVYVDKFTSACGNATWQMPADGTCNPGLTLSSADASFTNSSFGSMSEQTTLPGTPYCPTAQTDPGGDAGPVGIKTLCCP